MNKKINHRLKEEREKRGWSQARVAEQIDSDAINVSRWERGFSTPSPYYREKICRLYGKNAQDLGFLDETREEIKPLVELINGPGLPDLEDEGCPIREKPKRASKGLACLGYLFLWISGAFVFLLNNEDRFVRFHSLQSMLFFGGSNLISTLIITCLVVIMKLADRGDKFFFFGFVSLLLVLVLINVFSLVVWVVGMFQTMRGNYFGLPFVRSLTDRVLKRRRPTSDQ